MNTKKKILLLTNLLAIGIICFSQNPFITHIHTADPTARVFNDTLYVYPSHDIVCEEGKGSNGFCMPDYHMFSTTNFESWNDHGLILSQDDVPWVEPNSFGMWAPDCIEKDGKYYFYFPGPPKDSSAFRRIGMAVADHPTGPFKVKPDYIKGVNGIDPGLFIDDDGQAYLYFGGGPGKSLKGVKLMPDMFTIEGPVIPLEGLPEKSYKEGSFLFKTKGKYYFTFPHSPEGSEQIDYAIGDSPLGPFKYQGTIMDRWTDGCWTNHHSIVEYKNQWYIFYHHHDISKNQHLRSICVDKLNFNENGTIQKVKPTKEGVTSL